MDVIDMYRIHPARNPIFPPKNEYSLRCSSVYSNLDAESASPYSVADSEIDG